MKKTVNAIENKTAVTVVTPITNSEKTNKLFTIANVVEKLNQYQIGCKTTNNNGQYRILKSNTSIFVMKKQMRCYMCDDDFNNMKTAKLENVELLENANYTDVIRKHIVNFDKSVLDNVLNVLKLNKSNAMINQ